MHKTKNKAFTLVELIVVITILAILGTIAFISLQWYSTDARDSTRISDLSSMKTSLEVFHLDAWKYPVPTNWVDITYSWWVVWTQWSFWESVFSNVDKLDKIPTDPLTNKEYTYSITSNKNEFELAWLVEWDNISNNFLQNKVNAWTTEAKAIVTGTYNWMMSKSLTWSNCDALATPTIIANDISISTDLVQLINSWSLVYTWYKNLPATFKDSKFKYDWWFDFSPNKILVYTDTGSCANLTNKTDATARISMLKWLQDAYSGTILQNEWDIQRITSMTINESSPSSELISYAASFVNNNLGGSVALNNTLSTTNNTTPTPLSCMDILTTQDETDLNNLLISGDLYLARNSNWTNWFNSWDFPLTKENFCNNSLYWSMNVYNPAIFKLTNLVWLEIFWINANLPSSIWNLTHLSYLVIDWITWQLPNELWNLSNLTSLYIYWTFTTFPSTIWNLTVLNHLESTNSSLTSLPNEFWNLTNLVHLDLFGNSLTSLPSTFWNLSSLQRLGINSNSLSSLPSTFWNLSNLQYAYIHDNNSLSSLPDEIWNLTNLLVLSLNNNNLVTLPSTIWNMTNLQAITLYNNWDLTSLPTELWNLTNLAQLDFRWNPWLGNLNFLFNVSTANRTQWWMTIWWNWTKVVVLWTF